MRAHAGGAAGRGQPVGRLYGRRGTALGGDANPGRLAARQRSSDRCCASRIACNRHVHLPLFLAHHHSLAAIAHALRHTCPSHTHRYSVAAA
ncbi:MAG: hypothetical protein QM844_04190, partial [Planctomycetota bacterium]|nr:hypothetical protein [Planctomycetota bacterium]